VWIGRNGSGNGLFRGKLDDLRIWNVARSATEIANSFRAELGSFPAGLVGNWKFDEGSGTVAADTTATAENATLAGNAAWSPDVGNAPPVPDTTPPVISAVSASAVTSATATIGWTTNEASDTQVEFGTSTSYSSLTTLSSALVTNHSQQLSGLAAATTYHYRVRSRDGAGNLGLSGDFTFTTAAPDTTPPSITGVSSSGLTNTTATIGWATDEIADGQVDYGTTTAYGSTTTVNPALVTSHSQALSGLVASTAYHYRVRSRDGSGNLAVSGDFTFTTTNTPPLNSLLLNGTTGYAEASPAAELNITGDWTVEAWFKDETGGGYNHDVQYMLMKGNTDIDSEAPYLLGVSYGSLFAGERSGWTNYTVSASLGLVTANAWHHAAASFVASTRQLTLYLDGTQVAQGILGARTTLGNGRPVEIGRNANAASYWHGKLDDVRIWNVARTASDISTSFRGELGAAPASLVGNWKFNEGAGTVASDSTATAQNAALLGGASWSTDVGNVPPVPDTTPPVISGVAASAITSASAAIGWTTNEASDSQVEYGTTTSYGTLTTLSSALVTGHSQTIGGLSASTPYHYRVRSRDAAGNLAVSGDFTFTTGAPDTTPPVISGVATTAITNTAATVGWTTDEVADSQVEYGTTASYGTLTALDPTLVASHSQTLSGLTLNTLYHYRVRSHDAAGNLALSADVTFTTANTPPVNSLLLSGTGAYAEAANATELNITGDWTLESWFKDETAQGYNHDLTYILLKGNTDGNPDAPFMLSVGWNSIIAGERTGWANYTVSAPITGSSGTWHHVAAVFVASSRQVTIYLDGAQVAQGVLAARSTSGNALPVEIGRNGNGNGLWHGKLDDIRIWNIARTASDIAANYRAEFTSAPAGLVANWRFDEGSGSTASDATTTPENATLLGGAAWSTDIHP
jgi:hypothetical protein